jgi:hypothetical protein
VILRRLLDRSDPVLKDVDEQEEQDAGGEGRETGLQLRARAPDAAER